jgi:hypothetical protein
MTIKQSAAQEQVTKETGRRPVVSRQTIADEQANPDFRANYARLKADRLARESASKKG